MPPACVDKLLIIVALTAILLGWFSHSFTSSFAFEAPYTLSQYAFGKAAEVISPADHLKEDQIRVYNDYAVIHAPNLLWAKFTNTNSMDPVLDAEANSLEITPQLPEEIHVGDIISYQHEEILIIHRVIKTGHDGLGWYAFVKGDNNPEPDPEKIRFSQVKGIVVAVLY